MYISQEMKSNREEMTNLVWQLNHTPTTTINEMSRSQQNFMKNLSDTLMSLTEKTEARFSKMRDTIEFKLKEIQDENSNRLEQMRQTLDEKLHSTLNMRLKESRRGMESPLGCQSGSKEVQRVAREDEQETARNSKRDRRCDEKDWNRRKETAEC